MTIEQTPQLDTTPFATNDEWLAQYIFGSFYFSQGSPTMQNDIDSYAVSKFRANFVSGQIWDGNSRESLADPLLIATAGIISTYIGAGKHFEVSHDAIKVNVLGRFDSIGEQISGASVLEDEESHRKLLQVILGYMYSRDSRFLAISGEASRRVLPSTIRQFPAHPRFATSILLAHLVDDKDARHPVFTQLFADMKQVVMTEPEYNFTRLQRLKDAVAKLQSRDARDLSTIFKP